MNRRPDGPLRIEVTRGGTVEAYHDVIGVAFDGGAVIAGFGDTTHRCSLRSCAKPVQAEVVHAATPDLRSDLLALACASHTAEAFHRAGVDELLALARCRPSDLACGPPETGSIDRRDNNCSGKHAAMLLACRSNDWSIVGYDQPDHPMQRDILLRVANRSDLKPSAIATATDGCGLPCFTIPLEDMAKMFTQLDPTITEAMRASPLMVGGPGIDDTELMQRCPGWTAKRGAEGLLCVQTASGTALVVKALDGSSRPLRPALAELAGRCGMDDLEDWRRVSVVNTLGANVGSIGLA